METLTSVKIDLTESNPLKKILEDVYKAKGKKLYKKIKWQIKFWTDEEFYKDEIVVVAAGTSAGKSKALVTRLEIELTLKKLEVRYRNQNNKLKSLICPSSTNVLLDNMVDTFIEFEPSFTYKVVSNRIELEESVNSDCDVIIALPQLCIANVDLLPKIDIFMLDEGHQWYFANNGKGSVDTIIKKIEPNQQILLTGSPSKFIAHKDKHNYKFLFVTVFDLMDEGLVHAPKVEIVSCSHKFKREDYKGNYGNLKSGKTSDKSKNKNSLREVLEEMMVKLYYNNDNKWLKNRKSLGKFTEIIHKINQMINEMGKSIIYCDSIPQANTFYKELCEMGLENQTLISHSKVDPNSDNFNEFKKNSKIKILISVDRGKLGFNESELFNVIDFTFTQSLDMLLQMLGRLLRLSDKNPDKRKIYYKVATVETAEYYSNLMLGVFHLFHIDWYSKYNGKNMGQILIPVVKKGKNKSSGGRSKKTNKFKPLVNIDDLNLLDINVYKNVLHSNDGKFETIKWTTLDCVRREFFDLRGPITLEVIENLYSSFKDKSFKEMNISGNSHIIGKARELNVHYDLMQKYNIKQDKYFGDKDYSVLLTCSNNTEAQEKCNAELQALWKTKDNDLIQQYVGHFEKLRVKGYSKETLDNFFNSLSSNEFPKSLSKLNCERKGLKYDKEFNGLYRAVFHRNVETYYSKILEKWGEKVPMSFLKDEDKLKKVKREIKSCKNYSEWFNKYKSSHNNILTKLNRYDLVDKLPRDVNKKHTKENIIKMLKKYKGKFPSEFRKNHNAEWIWVRKNKLDKELYKDLKHDPRRKQKI
jgi:hypothetical protein